MRSFRTKGSTKCFSGLRMGQKKNRVVAFLDFKMKVEPERLRETQLQFYGKSGMSWHGSAVFYKADKRTDANYLERMMKFESSSAARMTSERQSAILEAAKQKEDERLSMFFVDHIAENDKIQDRMFVASIIDALIYRIKKEIPEAIEISICTDNVKAYNNNVLPVMFPFICRAHDMEPSVYLHPDACCGKNCVDAHFALSFRHLKIYILETRNDVLTPEDIVDALIFDGGVKNTFVDFIKTNRLHEDILRYECANEPNLIYNLRTPCEV